MSNCCQSFSEENSIISRLASQFTSLRKRDIKMGPTSPVPKKLKDFSMDKTKCENLLILLLYTQLNSVKTLYLNFNLIKFIEFCNAYSEFDLAL